MSEPRPYYTGNDDWIIDQCSKQFDQYCGSGFTVPEMYRALYLAAEGKHYLTKIQIEALERNIIFAENMARRSAVKAAKTKN